MTAMKNARKTLTTLIEQHALDHEMTFTNAAREVTSMPENLELVTTAFGNWWKAKPLTYAMILGLRNRRKQGLVRYFELLNEEQIWQVQPYIPVKKRIKLSF